MSYRGGPPQSYFTLFKLIYLGKRPINEHCDKGLKPSTMSNIDVRQPRRLIKVCSPKPGIYATPMYVRCKPATAAHCQTDDVSSSSYILTCRFKDSSSAATPNTPCKFVVTDSSFRKGREGHTPTANRGGTAGNITLLISRPEQTWMNRFRPRDPSRELFDDCPKEM